MAQLDVECRDLLCVAKGFIPPYLKDHHALLV